MKGRKKEKIGTIVGHCSEAFINRFKNANRLRSEAYTLLERCNDITEDIWKDLETEYKLSGKYKYQVNHKDRSIMVFGYKKVEENK